MKYLYIIFLFLIICCSPKENFIPPVAETTYDRVENIEINENIGENYYFSFDSPKNIQKGLLYLNIKDSTAKGVFLDFSDGEKGTLSGVFKNDSLKMRFTTGHLRFDYLGKGKFGDNFSLIFKKGYDPEKRYWDYHYDFKRITKTAYDSILLDYEFPLRRFKGFEKDTIVGNYQVKINIKTLDKKNYLTTISIFNQKTKKLLQTINDYPLTPDEGVIKIKYADYNFDGYKDLIIPTTHRAAYDTMMSYYYRFNPEKNIFEEDIDLQEIVSGSVFIDFDHQRKRVISSGKSGCCWHIDAEYKILNGKYIETKSIERDHREAMLATISYTAKDGKKRTIKKKITENNEEKIEKLYQSIIGY